VTPLSRTQSSLSPSIPSSLICWLEAANAAVVINDRQTVQRIVFKLRVMARHSLNEIDADISESLSFVK